MVDFEKRPVDLQRGWKSVACGASPGMLIGLLLVLLGGLLFVDNLDLLPFSVASLFWPLAILAYCGLTFIRTVSPVTRTWTLVGMSWGALLFLDDVHIIHIRGAVLWPLILIAAGLILLQYRVRFPEVRPSDWRDKIAFSSNKSSRAASSGRLEEFAIFSGVKRRIETISLEGGELTSVFGAIEIDLRKASISNPERIASIEANVAFGAVEIRIPESWRVDMRGNAVFGAYEDKSIPPRPDPGSPVPTLQIFGGTAFGAVVVKN
jgi:predicted membrane protein